MRSRYFEAVAYRSLFKEYFHAGARWTSAPRPVLTDELYDYRIPAPDAPMRYTVNEFEPVFDAADFVKCGRDLFVTRSNVTNRSGIIGRVLLLVICYSRVQNLIHRKISREELTCAPAFLRSASAPRAS